MARKKSTKRSAPIESQGRPFGPITSKLMALKKNEKHVFKGVKRTVLGSYLFSAKQRVKGLQFETHKLSEKAIEVTRTA